MSYKIAEVFRSIQGEGTFAGCPAVFVRFAGCNLSCSWCDTDHTMREEVELQELVDRILSLFIQGDIVVLTGGEPTLQPLVPLILSLREESPNIPIHLETNGTIEPLDALLLAQHLTWITISPKVEKPPQALWIIRAKEIKIVYRPGSTQDPMLFTLLRGDLVKAHRMFLQPCSEDFEPAVQYVWSHPEFRLSIQLHKILKIR